MCTGKFVRLQSFVVVLVAAPRPPPPPDSSLACIQSLCSVLTVMKHKGACNQGKEAFRAKSMQSGQLRPLCDYWRSTTNARLRVSQETGKKKPP